MDVHYWNSTCTPNGFKGTSLTMYDKQNDEWHQTWTDNAGYLLKLKGKLIGESMVMFGFSQNKGQRILNKISWTPSKDGTVRQHWQISSDNGKTWSTAFDWYVQQETELTKLKKNASLWLAFLIIICVSSNQKTHHWFLSSLTYQS